MPRRVDHAEQRRVITAAVARIVARDGVAAVTMRDVAAEAGIKTGRLQHYVASKDELPTRRRPTKRPPPMTASTNGWPRSAPRPTNTPACGPR